jgi:hypothetical protein
MMSSASKPNKTRVAKAGGGLPPIYRDAQRLVVLCEQAVRSFARYHKYTLGAELRTQAYNILRAVHAAWFDRSFALGERLQSLAACIDHYKISLQIAKRIEAFASFAQFEGLAASAVTLGKQCGGWLATIKHPLQQGVGYGLQPSGAGQKPTAQGESRFTESPRDPFGRQPPSMGSMSVQGVSL